MLRRSALLHLGASRSLQLVESTERVPKVSGVHAALRLAVRHACLCVFLLACLRAYMCMRVRACVCARAHRCAL